MNAVRHRILIEAFAALLGANTELLLQPGQKYLRLDFSCLALSKSFLPRVHQVVGQHHSNLILGADPRFTRGRDRLRVPLRRARTFRHRDSVQCQFQQGSFHRSNRDG